MNDPILSTKNCIPTYPVHRSHISDVTSRERKNSSRSHENSQNISRNINFSHESPSTSTPKELVAMVTLVTWFLYFTCHVIHNTLSSLVTSTIHMTWATSHITCHSINSITYWYQFVFWCLFLSLAQELIRKNIINLNCLGSPMLTCFIDGCWRNRFIALLSNL